MTKNEKKAFQKVIRILFAFSVTSVIALSAFAFFLVSEKGISDTLREEISERDVRIAELEKENHNLISEGQALEDEVGILSAVVKGHEIDTIEMEALRAFYERTTGNPVGEVRKVAIEATRYTNAEGWWEEGDPNWGMMANGQFTSRGAVAAPRSIPFGSNVLFTTDMPFGEEEEVFTVGDRGGAIKEREDGAICIDIWTPENKISDAFSFGRLDVEGYVIIPGDAE